MITCPGGTTRLPLNVASGSWHYYFKTPEHFICLIRSTIHLKNAFHDIAEALLSWR